MESKPQSQASSSEIFSEQKTIIFDDPKNALAFKANLIHYLFYWKECHPFSLLPTRQTEAMVKYPRFDSLLEKDMTHMRYSDDSELSKFEKQQFIDRSVAGLNLDFILKHSLELFKKLALKLKLPTFPVLLNLKEFLDCEREHDPDADPKHFEQLGSILQTLFDLVRETRFDKFTADSSRA